MRYIINKKLRNLILKNKIELSKNPKLYPNIKNLIYKNKSISKKHFNEIGRHVDLDNINLKEIKFNPQQNLGEYSQSKKIIFSGRSKKFAEIMGIILGDGNLYKNSIRITLHKFEKDYLEYIKLLIVDLFGIKPKEYHHPTSNTITLYMYNKCLVDLFLKEGLQKGNKVMNQVGMPSWIKEKPAYALSCLRGLIDTDGCVYMCKRDKKIYIKFTNKSQNLINDVLKISKNNDIHFSLAGRHNICLYKREEITKYLKKVGFSNKKHIDRAGL